MWHASHRLRNWKSALPFLLGLALLGWALQSVSFADVRATLAQLSIADIGLLIIANAIVIVLLTWRWAVFLRAQQCYIPLRQLITYRLAAFGVSYFTPGPHFGGEPLQVYLPVKRNGIDVDKAVTAVALDKTIELIVNFTFLVAAAIYVLQRGLLTSASGLSIVGYALLLLTVPGLLLALIWAGRHPLTRPLRWWQRWRPSARLEQVIARVHRSEDAVGSLCRTQPRAVAMALLLALLAWVAMIVEFWLATRVLGIDLSFGQALTALLAMRLAILLPMPAGLGALEASLVLAMDLLGMGSAAGISLALLIRTRDVLLGILGLALGGYALWRRPPSLDTSIQESDRLANSLRETRGSLHEA